MGILNGVLKTVENIYYLISVGGGRGREVWVGFQIYY